MKRLTFLVTPICAVGHVNACIGTTLPLLKRGHRVVFFLDETYRGKARDKGFEEFIYSLETQKKSSENDLNPAKQLAIDLLESKVLGPFPKEEQMEGIRMLCFESDACCEGIRKCNEFLKVAIEQIKPDCFVVDYRYLLPVIQYSGIPWIHHISCAPLIYIEHDDVSPGVYGMSSTVNSINLYFIFCARIFSRFG